jgi:hypothetical protein
MSNILKNVQRLVRAATGEEYGNGSTVTDIIVGYAEPGYGNADSVIVLGDWNPQHVSGEDRWTSTDKRVTMPVRLATALERVGAEIQWRDEWTQCGSCFRAIRTQPDSYGWMPSYVYLEDNGPTCADCLISDGEDALTGFGNESDSYVNNASKCLTWCERSHVESFGFVKWEPGEEHTYESGWHPGQTDAPEPILAAILERYPNAEVVFFLDESSQFYVRFSAYVRGIPA